MGPQFVLQFYKYRIRDSSTVHGRPRQTDKEADGRTDGQTDR